MLQATIVASLLGALVVHRAAAAATLTVCVDQANPTSTMDARIARAAAKTQGYGVDVVPFVGYGKGGDGFPITGFSNMAQSQCQLVMGFPVDVSNPKLPRNVAATAAYASTGFVLVRPGTSKPLSLNELPKGSEVGIAQLDTYAGLLYGIHPNIVMHVYPSVALMLADLEADRIAAGLAWQPSVEFYASRHRGHPPFGIRSLPDAHMVWNLVALYASQSNSVAKLFNAGLDELQRQGQLHRLIRPYQGAAEVSTDYRSALRSDTGFSYAITSNVTSGRMIHVADMLNKPKRPHRKAPALYSADQAARGALGYGEKCAMCHGPLLDGQSGGFPGPALKGPEFADPSYDFHVSDIFNFVAKLMPPGKPGSLTQDDDVLIMAYLLQQNGYPAGTKELTYVQAEKSSVPLRYYGN